MRLIEKYNDISYIKFQDSRPQVVLDDKRGGKVSYRGENRDRLEKILKQRNGNLRKDCRVLTEVID